MKESAYLLQALLIALWWAGLLVNQSFFKAFQFEQLSPTAFSAFLLPDLLLIAGLSIYRCYRRSQVLEWIIFGGFAYATLFCLSLSAITLSGILPTGLMILGVLYNALLCTETSFFRGSQSGLIGNSAKTILQIICIWSITLLVIPIVILNAFEAPLDSNANSRLFSMILFAIFSAFGLTSAFYMVRDGDGTPVPLDQTNRLVSTGPYRYVRNPMAIAGIGQGLCVALYFQSIHLLIYSLMGALVWHVVVRPIEERDLESRFGESYNRYRQEVRCWLPRFGATVRK